MQWDGYWKEESIEIKSYEYRDGILNIKASVKAKTSACPQCQKESSKIHSRYERVLADLPCFGAFCYVSLDCRRFFCSNVACKRKVFCERLRDMANVYARKSNRLKASLFDISFRIAAHAAAQLCKHLGIKTSASAIDRYIRGFEHKAFESPRVLGIDDWSMCRGKTYGTLLVDLEKQQPIDVLEGRDAATLTTWLKQHPEIEIISRDRSAEYALAVKQGATQALEIADRWHLLKNLREMIERYFQANSKTIQLAYEQTLEQKSKVFIPEPSLSSSKTLEKQHKRQQRHERFNDVHKLFKEGSSKRQIAMRLGLSRGTVIRYLASDSVPEQTRTSASHLGKLKPFVDYLNQSFVKGCHNISQLWRDIQAQGYQGKRAMVKRYVHYLKRLTSEQLQALTSPTFHKPRPKGLSYDVLKSPEDLTVDKQLFLTKFREVNPDFSELETQSLALNKMIKQREPDTFTCWLKQATQSAITILKNFALNLEKDKEAVHNAMKYHWSNGQLEGQVNRLKTIKRQMYGRANFDLLRARVLYNSS